MDVTTDVLNFVNKTQEVQLTAKDLKAFHELTRITNAHQLLPIIAKFVYFDQKSRIWGCMKSIADFRNPLNGLPVYLEDRLTNHDKNLMDYDEDLGLKTMTNNSKFNYRMEM